jgi:enoyl-CoA hydratase
MPVQVEDVDGVRVVTLDNPARSNALDTEMLLELAEAFDQGESDPSVRVLVLTGVGERAFCAGMDLKSPSTRSGPASPVPSLFSERFYRKPVVAAVNGAAVGGGFGLVLAADIVIVVDHALFGIPEVQRGLVGVGVVSRASTRLRPTAVLELALTGELVGAERAKELGIVSRITPAAELRSTAMAVAGRIAVNAPLAVAATKEVIYDVSALGRVDLATLRAKVAYVATSADAAEGRRAFNERRPPTFRGE